MIELKTPRGLSVNVPEIESEDSSPKFVMEDSENFINYYHENEPGIAVVVSMEDAVSVRGGRAGGWSF